MYYIQIYTKIRYLHRCMYMCASVFLFLFGLPKLFLIYSIKTTHVVLDDILLP